MPVHLVDHPIAQDALLKLRSKTTDPGPFRALACRLSLVVTLEATRELRCEGATVDTPLESVAGTRLRADIVVVPVLRAGLGMLDAVLQLLPDARVGHVGLQRDERTAVAGRYYLRLPPVQADTTVLVVDPMLATGGSARAAVELLCEAGATDIRLLCIVAAPEGLEDVQRVWPGLHIYTAAVDRELDARKFILPGLGDFGDRLYGT